jgi:prepilin-type N-terminal cleavage/methylation domain-containing protein
MNTTIPSKTIRAFTLLEVLMALAVVTLVILGPLIMSVNAASQARQTQDIMISTYLAEEALELLHHQYASIYIQCINHEGMCTDAVATLDGETESEKAWRLFKERLADNSSVNGISCFDECAYDFLDMINATLTTVSFYPTTGSRCPSLTLVSAIGTDAEVKNFYVCSGIASHLVDGFTSAQSKYSRKIKIESLPTYESAPVLEQYHDDLLVTATVSFRRTNGTLRSIKVSDFIHARS